MTDSSMRCALGEVLKAVARALRPRHAVRSLFCAMLAACAGVGAPPPSYSKQHNIREWIRQSPGYYGWNDTWEDLDIDGEVGHPIPTVRGPRIFCVDGSLYRFQASVQSGSLPDGLQMDGATGDITGIPERRAHYVVRVAMSNGHCGGTYLGFGDSTQEIRFHITGSGQVIR